MGLNKPVGFPTAKLLKEKGFDRKCTSFHDLISHNQIDNAPLGNYNLTKQSVSIPTIAEVVMWLYEKHGIWIGVDKTFSKEFFYNIVTDNEHNSKESKDFYNSPTEAYEAAIDYTLNNLI